MRVIQRYEDESHVYCGTLALKPYKFPIFSPRPDTKAMVMLDGWHDVLITIQNSPVENGRATLAPSIDGERRHQVQYKPSFNIIAQLSPLCFHATDVEIRDNRMDHL